MLKYITTFLFCLASFVGFSQAPWEAASTYSNGESYANVRGKINTNATYGWLRDVELQDTTERHLVILGLIYGKIDVVNDSLDVHNTRLLALENALIGVADSTKFDNAFITDTVTHGILMSSTAPGAGTFIVDLSSGFPILSNGAAGNCYIGLNNSYIQFRTNSIIWYLTGSYWRSSTDTLATRAYVRSVGGGTGTGDVKVSGTTANYYSAHWNGTDSTLVADDIMKYFADSVQVNDEMCINDSLRLNIFKGESDVYLGLTPFAAVDTGKTPPAWSGLVMKLPSLRSQLRDLVNGEMPWYIDNDLKIDSTIVTYEYDSNVKKVYGLSGLGPIATDNALTIRAEMTSRYIYNLQKVIFVLILVIIGLYVRIEILANKVRKVQKKKEDLKLIVERLM